MKEDGISKAEANYKVAPDGEPTCASCQNFISPGSCKLVAGTISENGTCDMYTAQGQKDDLETMLFGGANG